MDLDLREDLPPPAVLKNNPVDLHKAWIGERLAQPEQHEVVETKARRTQIEKELSNHALTHVLIDAVVGMTVIRLGHRTVTALERAAIGQLKHEIGAGQVEGGCMHQVAPAFLRRALAAAFRFARACSPRS